MSDLRKTINRLLRGDKPTANSRWVTTRGTSVWDESAQRFVTGDSEGYWYEGDWSLAMDTFPVWATGGWRFRKDDGTEATATYYQAEDTNVPKTDGINAETAFRFRIAAGETAKANLLNVGSWTLQFNNDDSPGWITVGATTDVSFNDSANLTNGTAITTSRLTAAAGTTFNITGFGDECEDGVSISSTYDNRQGAEVEYALILDSGVLEDAVITFRLLDPEGNPITLTGVPQLIAAAPPIPNLNQNGYRFVNNNGSESGSTLLGTINTAYEGARGAIYRCRIQINNSATSGADTYKPQYRVNGGAWGDLIDTGTDVKSSLSTFYTDNTATTERLAGAGTFTAGEIIEGASPVTGSITIGNGEDTEIEFAFETVNLISTEYVEFQLVGVTGGVLDTYSQIPRFNVASTAVQTVLETSFATPSGDGVTSWRTGTLTDPDWEFGNAGTEPWATSDDILIDTGDDTSCGLLAGELGNTLYVSGFDFLLQSDATIDGVEVQIYDYGKSTVTPNTIAWDAINLVITDGETLSTNDNKAGLLPFQDETDEVDITGGPTDTWGDTLTKADIERVDFGFAVSVINNHGSESVAAFLQYTDMRVHYSASVKDLLGGGNYQQFKVWARRDASNSGTGAPTVDLYLYESGVQKQIISTGNSITSDSGQWVIGYWNATNLTDITGVNVEIRAVGQVGGTGINARTVEFGAVEWHAEHVAAPGIPSGDGAPSVTKFTAAGTGVHTHKSDGSPSITKPTAEGAGVHTHGSDGAPAITKPTADGTAERILPADGSPSITKPTADGTGLPIRTADGSPSITKPTAEGTAKRILPADGSPSITKPTAEGAGIHTHQSDGAPSITKPTSDGSATIVGDATTADGSPGITPITAVGTAVREVLADGSPSIQSVITGGTGGFPNVVARTFHPFATEASTFNIGLGTPTAGNLGIIAINSNSDSTSGVYFIAPIGWTTLVTGTTGGQGMRALYAKIMEAGETTPAVVGSDSGVHYVEACFMEIENWYGSIADGVNFANRTFDAGNLASTEIPPPLTPAWGSAENLWIIGALWMDDASTVVSWPTNYITNGAYENNGAGPNISASTGTSYRQAELTTETPGTITLSESESVHGFTIAVRPSSGGSGSARIIRTADGSPSISPITAEGVSEILRTATGSPSINAITAEGTAGRELPADGSPSVTPITAEGTAKRILPADGAPSITPITSEGTGEIISSGPDFTADGSPSISVITAAGNSFIWPKVYLNTSETLIGATEMTISSVDIDGTSITFDDSVGAPVGALFLGVENRVNGDVGWIAVTVTEPIGPTIVFGGFGA